MPALCPVGHTPIKTHLQRKTGKLFYLWRQQRLAWARRVVSVDADSRAPRCSL